MVTTRHSLLLGFAALAIATGCEEEFRPITMLDDARILALLADPLRGAEQHSEAEEEQQQQE